MTQCLVSLQYGSNGRFSLEVDSRRVVVSPTAPRPNPHLSDELVQALEQPLDFPPLEQAVIPGDRVTIALDQYTPEASAIVAAVWERLQHREVNPEDVVILQPQPSGNAPYADPRADLPADVRDKVTWKLHDPSAADCCMYLATTSSNERIYLAREVVDADFVLPIGSIAYDPIIGYRGAGSVFYPGLSNAETIARAQGQGHHELGPEDDRPLRQTIDEISWLLGVQFAVQVIPSTGGGGANVLAGAIDSVFQSGKRLLEEGWFIQLDTRPEIVVAAVDRDAQGHGWEQVGSALDTARHLVARGGRIVLLTELDAELGRGLEIIRDSRNPGDVIRPLRDQRPADLIPATQIAGAVEWADVYFLSKLDSDLVEELFMIPLADEQEVARALSGDASCLFLEAAQHTFGRIRD
ncbi:MAG: lactate racemase domain-containing protein [Planctomycetaceae bacterium]